MLEAADAWPVNFGFLGKGNAGTGAPLAEQVRAAVEAGAQACVSPALAPEVIEACREAGVPAIPGAMTPTEIETAWRLGAEMVKVFPASVGGPDYVRAIRAPLPDIPLVPTGGVGIGDAAQYLAAGAVAVGIGSPLLGDACAGGDLDALRERISLLCKEIAS